MRLIHCASQTLKIFNNEQELPEYAILSHRWVDGQEVLFKDLLKSRKLDLSGWAKIRFCCSQALADGIEYCWIDTCCIDKTSSAELSEAINSMYRYYSNSKVCYSYLVDVDIWHQASIETQLVQSSWFTRCWTLQELLAPRYLEFFDSAWRKLGSRLDLCEEVAEASGIHLSVFTSILQSKQESTARGKSFDPEEWSIAQRMSWASKRRATRVEDVAYSLLGLFDVNMPLLYGEGAKAFLRLQEEIIRRSSDQTIFGWSAHETTSDSPYDVIPTGLLAPSPYEFRNDGNLTTKNFGDTQAYSINNLGLEISLPVAPWAPNVLLAGLNCTRDTQNRVHIFIMSKTSIVHSSIRAIYKKQASITKKWRLASSKHSTLTIATHLSSSVQGRLNIPELNHSHYLTISRLLHLEEGAPRYCFDSRIGSGDRPVYGFHCVLRYAASDTPKYINLVKAGFDFNLNPICIVSDQTYDAKGIPDWHNNVDMLYTGTGDIREKTFWECTGLEEAGWITPDVSTAPTPSGKTRLGVWALKGNHEQYCKFTLADDRIGGSWTVTFKRLDHDGTGTSFHVRFRGILHWM